MQYAKIKKSKSDYKIYLANASSDLSSLNLSASETEHLEIQTKKGGTAHIQRLPEHIFIYINRDDEKKENWWTLEEFRKAGDSLGRTLNKLKAKDTDISSLGLGSDQTLAFSEGMALGNYQFLRYFKPGKENSLAKINICDDSVSKKQVDNLGFTTDAVYYARDLVNTPVQDMTAPIMAEEFKKMAKDADIKIKVMGKSQIEKEKMGGLLAVNRGSIDEPRFTIMEYKNPNAKNKKPYVLVGKGVVYDTGGLSLKPTANSMDFMKSDMGGAAVMSGTIFAIAKAKLPVHVICLIPSTDNRPGGNAYAPGDVITMHNGMTVEVLNTDAEGRMILADAISYANRYEPEFIMDAATLTGAASRAFSHHGLVAMGNEQSVLDDLHKSGYRQFERVCEMPFWDDYAELLKSEIADMQNVGGAEAGSITAGKFLEKYAEHPYIHLDIAGPSFLKKGVSYRTTGGTGFGIRLLFDYFANK